MKSQVNSLINRSRYFTRAALLPLVALSSLFWGCEGLQISVIGGPDTGGTDVGTDTPAGRYPEIVSSEYPRCDDGTFLPKAAASAGDGSIVPGRYIVVMNDGVSGAALGEVKSFAKGSSITTFNSALNGFAARLSQQEVAQLRADPRVSYVEPDYLIKVDAVVEATGADPAGTPWGVTKVGGPRNGTGRVAWVVDTGIDLYNSDLNVDLGRSRNFVPDGRSDAMDQNGHGTHVAGTIGARDNGAGVVGVAPNATLVAVRVLNDTGAGYYSSIISGIDYVAANARSGDVMNLSLGGPSSRAIDDAVRRAAGRGIKIAVAAGNESQNTAGVSPARLNYPGIYTVSAVDRRDGFARFSNYGSAVDVAAPGVSISSTRLGGGVATMSGTSMATPHVAGLLLLGKLHANGYALLDPDGCDDPLAYR